MLSSDAWSRTKDLPRCASNLAAVLKNFVLLHSARDHFGEIVEEFAWVELELPRD